jgi:hypothetical protein
MGCFYNCCWPSPAQSFSGSSPMGLVSFYCLRFEPPQPGGPGPHIYIPQEQGGQVITPGTGSPFRHLLQLAGLRWRYSVLPPHGQYSLNTVLNVYIKHRILPRREHLSVTPKRIMFSPRHPRVLEMELPLWWQEGLDLSVGTWLCTEVDPAILSLRQRQYRLFRTSTQYIGVGQIQKTYPITQKTEETATAV